jgi:integrase
LPEKARPHDLGRTCATLLLGKGAHPEVVQERLGHATISITLGTHSHVLPGTGGQAASVMDEAL